jgi:anthranilate phosphoribosyltransferase
MRQIMRGEVSSALLAAILTGLRVKKESIGEISAAAEVMRELAAPVRVADRDHFVDIVGTGGDGGNSFNISTAAMFVVAAAGARVAKHGNRSVSSKSGSADVLEALGASIELAPEQVAACIEQVGIGFILGPLTNPAGAPNILLGVFHPDLVGILVRVLKQLGAKHALVVWGKDGMDEISLGAATLVGELRDGVIREYEVHPEEFGFAMASGMQLRVNDAAESRARVLEALDNTPGVARDIVSLNAGAALYAADAAPSIPAGIAMARTALDSGAARAKLDEFVRTTRRLAGRQQA